MMKDKLGRLMAWRSPFLGPSSFGCVAVQRDKQTQPSTKEIDDLVHRLPQHLDFEARFHGNADSYWYDEPNKDDFENDEAYQDAYQEFLHE